MMGKPLQLDMIVNDAVKIFTIDKDRECSSITESETGSTAAPFVKWAGGKRSIIKTLVKNIPSEFNRYYEPFVGGGALFFEIHENISQAFLSDVNIDLVITYNAIQKEPEKLIAALKIHARKHCKDYYYKIRDKHNLQDSMEIAARFLYLNKTCFNGLYRVNKDDKFNVPVGKYSNPNIVQEQRIMACGKALSRAKIEYGEFDSIKPQKGDFVYFDPPYHPTDEISFTSYTKMDFSEKDQERLADFARKLHKQGVKVMISNSKTNFIKDIYKGKPFNIRIVEAPRLVNCKADKRGAVQEVLITGY